MAKAPTGPLLIVAAAALWGTTGTAQALAPVGATSAAVGTLRLVIGGAVLLLIAVGRGQLRLKGWRLLPTLLGAGLVAAYQLTFFYGVARAGVAVGTIVGIGSAPIFGGLVGVWLHGERLSRRWLVATLLAVVGCVLLVSAGGRGASADVLGIVLALGAGLSYAGYTASAKALLAHHPPGAVMAVLFGVGALLLLPTLIGQPLAWVATGRGVAVAAHLGLLTVGVAYLLYARGLLTVPVSTTTTLTLAEPLTAGLLGVLILREGLTPTAAIGIGLIAAGLVLLTVRANPDGPGR